MSDEVIKLWNDLREYWSLGDMKTIAASSLILCLMCYLNYHSLEKKNISKTTIVNVTLHLQCKYNSTTKDANRAS